MSNINLSKIDDNNLTDEQIEKIVFSNIDDDNIPSEYDNSGMIPAFGGKR